MFQAAVVDDLPLHVGLEVFHKVACGHTGHTNGNFSQNAKRDVRKFRTAEPSKPEGAGGFDVVNASPGSKEQAEDWMRFHLWAKA